MKIRHAPRDLARYIRRALALPERTHRMSKQTDTLEQRSQAAELALYGLPLLASHPQAARCQLTTDSPFPLFNPSIVRLDDGRFLCMARSTNLVNYAEWHYHLEQDDAHSTNNYLFTLDSNLRIESCQMLDDTPLRQPGSATEGGLEDCRLFRHRGAIWGIGAAVSVKDGRYGTVRQALFRLDGNTISEHHLGPLPFGRTEKNWTPVEDSDSIRLLYKLAPPVTLEFRDGTLDFTDGQPVHDITPTLRGGTPLVRFGEHYLGIAHSAPYRVDRRIHYLHYLVVFDQSLRHIETSQPFFLRRRGIEFACGLQLHDGMAYISYGVADRAAEVMRVPVDALMDWLVAEYY